MAARAGLGVGYGRAAWFGGTIMAWPVGLYVLASGRLVLVDTELKATIGDAGGIESETTEPLPTDTGG